mgnify:CR=1 FL=1
MHTVSKDKIPTAKISRAIITAKTTAKITLKHTTHLSKRAFLNPEKSEQHKIQHQQDIGKILIAAFMQLRGTALKIAQLLSMELDLLPESIRKELSKACSEVSPLNRAHIHKVYKSEFAKAPDSMFYKFNSTAFAAASLGQVHKATIKIEDKKCQQLAIKIQYPGISATIKSDMKIVRTMMKSISVGTNLLPRYDVIDKILNRINEQLQQEVDYRLEAKNTQWFKDKLNIPNIRVPKIYTQFSGSKVLATEFIEGLHLNPWLANKPNQRQRNRMGQLLFGLFCFQLHELKVLHADPHPGNILFCEDGQIALIDFGCVHHLQTDYPKQLNNLFTRDPQQLYQTYQDMKIIKSTLDFEIFRKEFFPVVEDMLTWMTRPFINGNYDFSDMPAMPAKPLSQVSNAMKHVDAVQKDQMYFDRSFFGLLFMLRKLGATINTSGMLLA